MKISCDESSYTNDYSSPLRKKRNINKNDKTIQIHDSFRNSFDEVAEDEVVEKKSVIANEIEFYMKTLGKHTDTY